MKSRIVQDQFEHDEAASGRVPHVPPPRRSQSLPSRIGRWSARNRKKAIFGWLGFVVVVFMAGGAIGTQNIAPVDTFSGESHDAEVAATEAGLRPNKEIVLIHSQNLRVEDQAFTAAVHDATSRLADVPYVENVSSPFDKGGSVTDDGHSALVKFEIAGNSDEATDRVDATIAAVNKVGTANPDVEVSQFGTASASVAVGDTISGDLGTAGKLSLPVTLVILTIAFGSLLAAGVPLLLGLSAVIGALGLSAFTSQVFPADPSVPAVVLMIGLAVGVDYSLFYLRREREERAAGHDAATAIDIAGATSGRAVLVSGITVMTAMAGMFISGDPAFVSFAIGTMMVVALAVVASLTVLPAMIAGLGKRLERGRIPGLRDRSTPKPSRLWTAVIDRVTAHPLIAVIVTGGLLLALAIPAFGLKTVDTGPSDLDQSIPVIQAYDQVKKLFPVEGTTASVVVQADDVRSNPAARGIDALVAKAKASDTFPAAPTVDYSDDGTVAEVVIPTRGDGTDQASEDALNEVRNDLVPTTVGNIAGVEANVTGDAASTVDSRDQLQSRLPLIFGFVFTLAFLLMMVTFRSIVIPIKAIVLNLLSVGAAYGVLVLIFQDGHGESLLGFSSNGGVTSWLPMFLFVILFGLSMDYHVFILSRVKELHDGGMNTSEAVRQAIATTAGTVTAAACVMIGVFTVFATLEFIDFKELGVGLAVAVAIDATLVRGVLLPASMQLLGDWNWYLPRFLERIPGGRRAPRPSETAPSTVPVEPARV